ncbi:MAG: divalent-cation tolerance protein CutA [Lentisphaeraceae bacterium]|nr:divalent-cation tolerance protein CutA [Lentisphaeraceae bacterium]
MSSLILFYVPCPNIEEAKKIARFLLKRRRIACANILDNCTSIYEWEGEIQEENEVILIMKTVKSLHLEVEKEIAALHPYDCPAIVALDTSEVNMPFEQWVSAQTGSAIDEI